MIDVFNPNIDFEQKALELFSYQQRTNPIYARFCKALGITKVNRVEEIPLLPIQAFKDAEVLSMESRPDSLEDLLYFESSGTSGMKRSRHYVPQPDLYKESIRKGMELFYPLDDLVIWAYTPGYSSNPHSSLIWMLESLIQADTSDLSRFLKLNEPLDQEEIDKIASESKQLMLFGAAFGLLDLMDISEVRLPADTIVMETGGMKTYKREMTKAELHQQLASGLGLNKAQIHSEYGMTELLSQAYSLGDGRFECVPWMQVSIRNPENPMEIMETGREGLIGVIDFANVHSSAFVLTGDKGIMDSDNSFQVLGRWNPQNLRGCNFLIDND